MKRDGKLVELQDFAMQQKLYDVDGVQQYTAKKLFGYHLENGAKMPVAMPSRAPMQTCSGVCPTSSLSFS